MSNLLWAVAGVVVWQRQYNPVGKQGSDFDSFQVGVFRDFRLKGEHILGPDLQRFDQLFVCPFLGVHTRQIHQPADPPIAFIFYNRLIVHCLFLSEWNIQVLADFPGQNVDDLSVSGNLGPVVAFAPDRMSPALTNQCGSVSS